MYAGGIAIRCRAQDPFKNPSLTYPASVQVTRYIDANPLDLQLDIPMLGQFRIFFFVHDAHAAATFLNAVTDRIGSSEESILYRASRLADQSYATLNTSTPESAEYMQPQRYTAVSKLYTPAIVTTAPKDSCGDCGPACITAKQSLDFLSRRHARHNRKPS